MIIRLNAAMRRQGDRHERGAATLETVGMYLVAALLAVALMLAAMSSSPVVADKFRQAVCMVVTLGQGPCEASVTSAAEHEPTEPCVVSAQGRNSSSEGTVLVTVGNSDRFLIEALNNGRFRVTRASGTNVGVGVGLGAHGSVTVDGKTVGAGATADANVGATFSNGDVYNLDSRAELDDLLKSQVSDQVYGEWGLGRFLADRWGKTHGWPTPDETFEEGGGTADASAHAGVLAANLKTGVGVQAILGVRRGTDGTSTTYLRASVDGNTSANGWAGGVQINKAGVEGLAEAVVEVERDSKGIITAVRAKSTLAGTVGAAQHYGEMVVDLPIKSVADQKVAQRYLNALGMGPMGGFNGLPKGAQNHLPIPNPVDALGATKAFAQAADQRGHVWRQFFDNSKSSSSGASGGLKLGVKVDLDVKVETVDRKSTGAEFYNGTAWVPWKGCGQT